MANIKSSIPVSFSMMIFFIAISCTPTGKLKFVTDEGTDLNKNNFTNDRSEKTIQPYDYLYIRVFSLDQRTNDLFNDNSALQYNTELLSYSVDEGGNINMPFVGSINVKGLTINEAKAKIEKSLLVYLNNISVVVRFVSNKITILGEVNRPGEYSFYDEKVTVFQALGFAGGSNTYADLSKVTLVREKDNIIVYHYLDLTKKNIAASEFYYLLPNDVVIINPINAKYRSLRDYSLSLFATILTSISAVLSAYVTIQTIKALK